MTPLLLLLSVSFCRGENTLSRALLRLRSKLRRAEEWNARVARSLSVHLEKQPGFRMKAFKKAIDLGLERKELLDTLLLSAQKGKLPSEKDESKLKKLETRRTVALMELRPYGLDKKVDQIPKEFNTFPSLLSLMIVVAFGRDEYNRVISVLTCEGKSHCVG